MNLWIRKDWVMCELHVNWMRGLYSKPKTGANGPGMGWCEAAAYVRQMLDRTDVRGA